jgi:hypothetical protein
MLEQKNFFISEDEFRVWLPEVAFIEKSEGDNEKHNSRKLKGIMSTQRKDRQGEILLSKGLDFSEFLSHGHFNDNHSQDTSAIVGYPEKVEYHNSLKEFGVNAPGWTCEGYVLKGTKRADAIWELARALQGVPDRKLGFSVEGKVERRADKTIEKAKIRHVAITNCPVNTDCTWEVLEKSFHEPEMAIKSMMAGYGVSPGTQAGGSALRTESLDSDAKKVGALEKRKKRKLEALMRALDMNDLMKAMDIVLDKRPDFDEDTAAIFIRDLYINKMGGNNG